MGRMYETGEAAPTAGVYRFARHVDGADPCAPTLEVPEIGLDEGERFPEHDPCGQAAFWMLAGET